MIDWKTSYIPDKIIVPAIVLLGVIKILEENFLIGNAIAAGMIVLLFLIPLFFGWAFGGGDLRMGCFCGFMLIPQTVGYFLLLSGAIHLIILWRVRHKVFGFAPAMGIATLIVYGVF